MLDRLSAWIDRLTLVSAHLAGAVLVAMMALTVIDVVLRYGLNAPIYGGLDVIEAGLVVVVFLGLTYCGRSGGHVALEVLAHRLSPGLERLRRSFVRLASATVMAALAVRVAIKAVDAWRYQDASNLLGLPFWPLLGLIAGGAGLYALALAVEAIAGIIGRPLPDLSPDDPDEGASP